MKMSPIPEEARADLKAQALAAQAACLELFDAVDNDGDLIGSLVAWTRVADQVRLIDAVLRPMAMHEILTNPMAIMGDPKFKITNTSRQA